MKTYLIEREIPGAGKLSQEQLKSISQTSCSVLNEMGPQIRWQHSYVTGDKIFCIYNAENEDLIGSMQKRVAFLRTTLLKCPQQLAPLQLIKFQNHSSTFQFLLNQTLNQLL